MLELLNQMDGFDALSEVKVGGARAVVPTTGRACGC
jgi:ATP-dependent 26S proteasome regulatory subunit